MLLKPWRSATHPTTSGANAKARKFMRKQLRLGAASAAVGRPLTRSGSRTTQDGSMRSRPHRRTPAMQSAQCPAATIASDPHTTVSPKAIPASRAVKPFCSWMRAGRGAMPTDAAHVSRQSPTPRRYPSPLRAPVGAWLLRVDGNVAFHPTAPRTAAAWKPCRTQPLQQTRNPHETKSTLRQPKN